MFIDFRQRGMEREKKNMDVERKTLIGYLPHTPKQAGGTCNQDMCPDWESNLQPSGVWDDAPTYWATWPGHAWTFLILENNNCCTHIYYSLRTEFSKR